MLKEGKGRTNKFKEKVIRAVLTRIPTITFIRIHEDRPSEARYFESLLEEIGISFSVELERAPRLQFIDPALELELGFDLIHSSDRLLL